MVFLVSVLGRVEGSSEVVKVEEVQSLLDGDDEYSRTRRPQMMSSNCDSMLLLSRVRISIIHVDDERALAGRLTTTHPKTRQIGSTEHQDFCLSIFFWLKDGPVSEVLASCPRPPLNLNQYKNTGSRSNGMRVLQTETSV